MDIKNTSYDPQKYEKEILKFWESKPYFKPEYKKGREKTFTITLPPPNANANLHVGHMTGYTYQDIMGRYHRMIGDKVLLIPGKDHASIQTEVVFEKFLEKQGIKKRDLGREEFYKRCMEFTIDNANNARNQEKSIGLSADFSREKFTLDPQLTKTVYETFIQMYNDNLIYRGKRIINYCPRCHTALADIDTEYKEEISSLYYIKYGDLVIATTRPETVMADTAIAVNPKDKRYKHLIGKTIEIESIGGKKILPVVSSTKVDIKFGTGVLKVTPGHSKDDFEIATENNLPIISIIDEHGRITYGKYKGMKVKEARDAVAKDLQEAGLIIKIEEIVHNTQICERCNSIIEPLISYQWFIKTQDLARKAIEALEQKKFSIYPKRQEKNYIRWLENLEDWCISRQLWWGQSIPVYYCEGKVTKIDKNGDITEKILGCGEITVSTKKITKCPKCGRNVIQDTDILDTWFSSSQWPYSCMGGIKSEDFKEFYPTSVMETGRDILLFWVARMVMMGIYKTGKVPFQEVYLHGLALDKEGKKQSKSKGNGIDPQEIIHKYGTDALRLSLISGNAPDQDFKLFDEKVRGFRNFINKVYNSSRYIILQLEELDEKDKKYIRENLKFTQKSIIKTKINKHIEDISKKMNNFEFGKAAFNIEQFYHHYYCDIYIEKTKEISNLEIKAELVFTLYQNLKLMHPFIPFITELIYIKLKELNVLENQEEVLMYCKYPIVT